ncbi:MAG: ATP-binding protein [Erysipelotrichaceae bacterium]|nr:ATP-binding protein [Erysipelotrichaceae bacterium]
MEKICFSFELTEEQKKEKEKLCQQLLKKKHVKKWMKQHQIDESYLFAHSGKIYDWNHQIEKCDKCEGLAFCRQPVKGCYYDLEIDSFLQLVLTKCKYQKEADKIYVHKKKYAMMDMPESYLLIDIINLGFEEDEDYQYAVSKIVELLFEKDKSKGLYLYGRPGVGKSYMAAGITNYFAKENQSVAYINVPKLISDLKLLFQDHDQFEYKLKMMKEVDVLVFDDIGGENISTWSRDEILLPLLDKRMQAHKLTFFTSNYKIDELKEKWALVTNKTGDKMAVERLIDRVKALSKEVFLKGSSRRK